MKKSILFFFIIILLVFPTYVFAINNVGYDLGKYECTSEYQDRNVSTAGIAYFSHCVSYYKQNNKCVYEYVDSEKVNCLNGNKDPYYETYKDGCKVSDCRRDIRYCSIILKYDCSKKSNGESFATTTTTTTTTTKKTTKKVPKTTTTQAVTVNQVIQTELMYGLSSLIRHLVSSSISL